MVNRAEAVKNSESTIYSSDTDTEIEALDLDVYEEKAYTYKGFRFYTIDLKNTPPKKLDAILKACEAIEKACWEPQENFFEFAKSKDILTYVIKEKKIVAFQIASYWIMDSYFIFDLDETMVMKECRGNSLAFAISALNCRTFYLKICTMKEIKKMTFISLTPNLRLVNLLDKIRHTIRIIDNTFNPSQDLMKIHDYILGKKGVTLVDNDFPFFLKNIFPGSLKQMNHHEKTSDRIKKMIPPDLDFNARGDAFLFIACFSKIRIWPIMVILLIKAMGIHILYDQKLGLFSRKKFNHVNQFFPSEQTPSVVLPSSAALKQKT